MEKMKPPMAKKGKEMMPRKEEKKGMEKKGMEKKGKMGEKKGKGYM